MGRRGPFLRAAVPLALVVLLALPLGWRLTTVPPPDPILESFNDAGGTPRPVTLHSAGRTAGADVFRLRLTASNAIALAAADEIHLLMANHGTAAALLEAWISLDGTACRFRTAPGAPLVNNAMLAFRRQASCDAGAASWPGELELEVRLDMGTGQAALWTLAPPTTGRVQLVEAGETLAVAGQTVKWPRPTLTRIELLAYMWQVTPPVLWARLRTIALLVGVGLTLLLWPLGTDRRRLAVACAALGTALVMSGLALGHAVLFPPLQTPDEPDFALGLAKLKNDEALAVDIEALARRTHFERLRHHSDRRFRERDIGQPWAQPLDKQIAAVPIQQRSPVAERWWNVIGARGSTRAVQYLWSLRRANAILFGVFCGAAVALLAYGLPSARPAALSLSLLAIPTLPFFGAYFSDTAVLVSVAVVLAACVAVLVIGSARDHWIGGPLAIALVLVWLTGRGVWPLVIAVGGVLAGRALAGFQPGRRRWHVLACWTPVTLAAGGGVWLAQRAGMFEQLDRFLRVQLPGSSTPFQAAVIVTPWIAAGLPIILASVEWLTTGLRWQGRASRYFAGIVTIGMAAWIVSGTLLSLLIELPESQSPSNRSAPFTYAWQVLASMAVPFRLAQHDLLLSTFFWSGMGWVDIVAPVLVLNVVIGATVVALVWSLMQARADAARALRYVGLVVGLTMALVVYAVGAYGLTYALYGRYLVGWYLLIVMTAWTAPALSPRPWWPWLVAALGVHAYYLQSIPVRYF